MSDFLMGVLIGGIVVNLGMVVGAWISTRGRK